MPRPAPAQNAYCSRDIYFQFSKVCRSVISYVDAMKARQRLVAWNALGCPLIWCRWQTKQRGQFAIVSPFLFANRTYAHTLQRHFKNSLLLLCIGSLFGKKQLNHRTNDEMSNYLCASEILIVS